MTRRDPLTIKAELLTYIAEAMDREARGIAPTALMFKANLSHTLARRLIEEMLAAGLVERHPVEKRQYRQYGFSVFLAPSPTLGDGNDKRRFLYTLTEKGYSVLKHYYIVREALKEG